MQDDSCYAGTLIARHFVQVTGEKALHTCPNLYAWITLCVLNMTSGTQHDLIPKAQAWLLASGHFVYAPVSTQPQDRDQKSTQLLPQQRQVVFSPLQSELPQWPPVLGQPHPQTLRGSCHEQQVSGKKSSPASHA